MSLGYCQARWDEELLADALVLLHEDKHAPCLGIYSIPEIDPNVVFDELV